MKMTNGMGNGIHTAVLVIVMMMGMGMRVVVVMVMVMVVIMCVCFLFAMHQNLQMRATDTAFDAFFCNEFHTGNSQLIQFL